MRTVSADGSLRSPRSAISTPVMDSSLQVTTTLQKTSWNLKWGTINGILLAIVAYDLSNPCPYYPLWLSCTEVSVAVLLLLSLMFHIGSYVWNTLTVQPVVLNPQQMKLLGVKKADLYFKVSTPEKTPKTPPSPDITADLLSTTPMNLSATSWRSASFLTAGRSDTMSPNFSMSATSWEYIPTSPVSTVGYGVSPVHSPQSPTAPGVLLDQSNFSNVSSVDVIDDEKSLSKYLQEFQDYEQSLGVPVDQTHSFGSLWRSSPSRIENDLLVSPLGCKYQMASPSSVQSTGSPGGTEGGSPSLSKHKSMELWRRLGVKSHMLTQWNANLRKWISQTVLERLVQEIDSVDEAFQRHGLTDMKIGFVGLERLKKTALMLQVVQNIPTLPSLVKFLEASPNQEYIVARIRELAKGGCMSDFRWNSGSNLMGKEWEDHLPTDSALVMHLVATYLDTQLPPQPHSTDRRPFSSEYFVKYPEKVPPGKQTPVIHEVQVNPPQYVFVVGEEKLEVDMGRNNLLHTIILFLHHMKTNEGGMLGRINLGPSGLNLLWVIDS